jgi:hypothetical protein
LTCRICQSINHFAKDCPDKKKITITNYKKKKKTTSSAYLVAQEDMKLMKLIIIRNTENTMDI